MKSITRSSLRIIILGVCLVGVYIFLIAPILHLPNTIKSISSALKPVKWDGLDSFVIDLEKNYFVTKFHIVPNIKSSISITIKSSQMIDEQDALEILSLFRNYFANEYTVNAIKEANFYNNSLFPDEPLPNEISLRIEVDKVERYFFYYKTHIESGYHEWH